MSFKNKAVAKPRFVNVMPSPFNIVKLWLACIMMAGVAVWYASFDITPDRGRQALIVLIYSVLSALWLVFLTYRVAKRCQREQNAANCKDNDQSLGRDIDHEKI